MNCCFGGNNYLWILMILLILGTCGNVFSSGVFKGEWSTFSFSCFLMPS